jgi:hypothetical protein
VVSGDKLCLHAGDYNGAWSLTVGMVTVKPYPGEVARLVAPYVGTCRNNLTLRESADFSVVQGLRFTNGNTGGNCENFAGIFLDGVDNAVIEQNEIDNITQHGVFGGYTANNNVVRRNFIHDVGTPHGSNNADHAIYFDVASGTQVVRNIVLRTPNGHAIQIYNGAANTTVAGNVVAETVCLIPCNNTADHATAGIIVASSNTTGTHVVNNILLNNSRGIFGYQTGSSNEAHANVHFGNPTCGVCNASGSSMSIGPNVPGDPLFASYPNDLHVVAGSPAIDAADPVYSFFPDYDGLGQNGAPDIGAYG